jgi:hypothetical protein
VDLSAGAFFSFKADHTATPYRSVSASRFSPVAADPAAILSAVSISFTNFAGFFLNPLNKLQMIASKSPNHGATVWL